MTGGAFAERRCYYASRTDFAGSSSASATIVGFSNVGDVTLFVNGVELGTKSPDAVKVVEWRDVPLKPGENLIELRSAGLVSSRSLRRL